MTNATCENCGAPCEYDSEMCLCAECLKKSGQVAPLPNYWSACERGNTLLSTGEGNIIAWLSLGDNNMRLEVSYCPDNYPALNVKVVNLTDTQLAEHINTKLQGWLIHKCNIEGVETELNRVKGHPDGSL
jgi:hypothetical protein